MAAGLAPVFAFGLGWLVWRGRGSRRRPQVPAAAAGARGGKATEASQLLDVLLLAGKLKRIKRTGWVNNGVQLPESIADHMYRMAIMGLLCREPGLSPEKCARIALAHDFAEAIVGDITPDDGVSDKDKNAMEAGAMEEVREMLGDSQAAQDLVSYWEDYEYQRTPEAKMVKLFDKLEMLITAYEYERDQPNMKLDQFFDSTLPKLEDSTVSGLVAELLRRRQSLTSAIQS